MRCYSCDGELEKVEGSTSGRYVDALHIDFSKNSKDEYIDVLNPSMAAKLRVVICCNCADALADRFDWIKDMFEEASDDPDGFYVKPPEIEPPKPAKKPRRQRHLHLIHNPDEGSDK